MRTHAILVVVYNVWITATTVTRGKCTANNSQSEALDGHWEATNRSSNFGSASIDGCSHLILERWIALRMMKCCCKCQQYQVNSGDMMHTPNVATKINNLNKIWRLRCPQLVGQWHRLFCSDIAAWEAYWLYRCLSVSQSPVCNCKIKLIASRRRIEYGGQYMAEVQLYKRDQFVYVNEIGCSNKNYTRGFSWGAPSLSLMFS